jgi:hypothetical protein
VAEESGGEREDTENRVPSPRQLIRGNVSSSELVDTLLIDDWCAAAFPREPWN